VHAVRLIGGVPEAPVAAALPRPTTFDADDFEPSRESSPQRLTVAASTRDTAAILGVPMVGQDSDRVVGTLVHRLLQRFGFDGEVTHETVARLLRAEEFSGTCLETLPPPDRLTRDAVAAYRAICARDDVRAVYRSGTPFHEVPFTMTLDGVHLRGTIDCVVRIGPASVAVLEFKTGSRRPEHEAQVEVYRTAVQRLFPGATVDTHLVYAHWEAPA
jgi:ATP-dependent exoDNAse (exonuclease V) beta subunit